MIAPLPQSWSEQLAPVTIKPFTCHVGPTVAIPDSPLEVSELFFTADLQQKIVDELCQAGNGGCPLQLMDKDYQGGAESLYRLFHLDGDQSITIDR